MGRLQGWRCSAVICREVEDLDDVALQLPPGAAQLLFWPGLMSPDPDKPPMDPPEHVQQAQRLGHLFDLIFLDPPFDAPLFEPALAACARALTPRGLVYLEAPVQWTDAQLAPLGLAVQRHLKAGAVHAHLLRRAVPL